MPDYPHDLRQYRHSELRSLTVGDDHPQYARRTNSVISGGLTVTGGITSDCPVVITGNCTNALEVEKATLQHVLRVDTSTSDGIVFLGNGPTTNVCLSIGEQGTSVVNGYALYKYTPGGLYWSGETRGMIHQPPTQLDRLIFGEVGFTTTSEASLVFAFDAEFRDGFGFERGQAINGAGAMAVAANYIHVAITAPDSGGFRTVTLPPVTPAYGSTGAKPGQLFLIVDETGLDPANEIRIEGDSGDPVNFGGAVQPFVAISQGAAHWFQSTGTQWYAW